MVVEYANAELAVSNTGMDDEDINAREVPCKADAEILLLLTMRGETVLAMLLLTPPGWVAVEGSMGVVEAVVPSPPSVVL